MTNASITSRTLAVREDAAEGEADRCGMEVS